MGNMFPYEVGTISNIEARNDESLIKVENNDIPDEINVFVEKTILNTLPDLLIIDFTQTMKIKFIFIPPIPKPLNQYDFYN